MNEIPRWFPDLCALLWPVQCAGCGAPDRACCKTCVREMLDEAAACVRILSSGVSMPRGVGIASALSYTGTLRALLIALKHGGQLRFVSVLSEVLALSLRKSCDTAPVSVSSHAPVYVLTLPSRKAAVRERGYAHLDLLVSRALLSLRWSAEQYPRMVHLKKGLCATAGRRSQVGLRADERETNAARIAVRTSCRYRLEGANVILVDDIVTTGASARAACEVLTAAGANVVGIATICWVPRQNSEHFL